MSDLERIELLLQLHRREVLEIGERLLELSETGAA